MLYGVIIQPFHKCTWAEQPGMCQARCQRWLFYCPRVFEVMLSSSRQTEETRAEEHHLWGASPLRSTTFEEDGWPSEQAWEGHICARWWSTGQRFWACWAHGSPGLTSAMQFTALLLTVLAQRQLCCFGRGDLCTVPCPGGDTWVSSRWRAAAECVIPCCASAQSKLFRHADEWKSCEKQMSHCLNPPACKEAGISVHYIKETLDPMWSIPPPNYYTLKDLNFWEVSQVKRGKNISGKVRKSVHFYKYLLVCIPLTLHD